MCEALIETLKLDLGIHNTIQECIRDTHHTEWYWRMRERGLSHKNAYMIAVAIHADLKRSFDAATCIIIPAAPNLRSK